MYSQTAHFFLKNEENGTTRPKWIFKIFSPSFGLTSIGLTPKWTNPLMVVQNFITQMGVDELFRAGWSNWGSAQLELVQMGVVQMGAVQMGLVQMGLIQMGLVLDSHHLD